MTYLANGDSVEWQLAKWRPLIGADGLAASANETCIVECSDTGGGGGGANYGPPLKIGVFELLDVYDFGNPFDSNEFRFETWLKRADGTILQHATTNADGLLGDSRYVLQLPIAGGSPAAFGDPDHVQLVIYEDDGWTGRDDFFDGAIPRTENAATNGWLQLPRFAGGNFRCDYLNNVGYHSCPIVFKDGIVFYWKQVNFNVYW